MNGNTATAMPGDGHAAGEAAANGHDGRQTTPPDPASMMASMIDWIEENQTLAMLGAFALGVFIGVMMRD